MIARDRSRAGVAGLACLLVVACSGSTEAPLERRRERAAAPSLDAAPQPPSTYPMPRRLVAIGDVHGDLLALRQALRAADAIDPADHWAGGDLFVVQTGDLLDRGDDEPEILALVSRLEREASEAGGHFVTLVGNHEVMNAQLDFRYVTPEGFRDYASHRDEASGRARRLPSAQRGRGAAFEPRSAIARQFAARNAIVIVGDTVLMHGGLAPGAASVGIDVINRAARAFFLGEGPLAAILDGEQSPIWHRRYAMDGSTETCAELARALETVHAERMVIGHTVQEGGITHACEGRVFRIDVGLARHYGGPIQALEITSAYSPAMDGTTGTRVLEGTR